MIALTTTSQSVSIITSTTAGTRVSATWGDYNGSTPSFDAGSQDTSISSATTTPVVAAPGSGVRRIIKSIVVYAAALQTVQLIKVNTTNFELSSVITLQAGWSLRVDEHGNMIVNTGSSLMIGSTNPLIDGVASPGSDTQYVSGATHVHPYPQHIQSNATTGLLQVLGPGAGTTRVMTTPNADFTVARTNGANTFNATQTISNGSLALSSTTDVTAEVATTGNSNAATIACSTGDGTTSGRYAYCYMISLETAPQRWDFGMRGTKSFVIRNQTLTRNDLTVNETSGTVSAAAFQGAYNSSDGTAGKTVVVSIGANTLTFKNGILTANT